MPELPDIHAYLISLRRCVLDQRLEAIRLWSPFLVRSVAPPVESAAGRVVSSVERIGKRVVLGLENDLFIVVHLMIAGRFRWRKAGAKPPGKMGLAAFDFPHGTLLLTEAASKKRAAMHMVSGADALAEHDPGGRDVFALSLETFAEILRAENHTLKRSLTDPRMFDGIGNAYSDEILHRARLSPMLLTARITDEAVARLFSATKEVLGEWCERLGSEAAERFPEKVTAFRDGMAVHGRYGEPCPVCEKPVQRIVYASNETNYCPTCQTEGKLLADRALSKLLKKDWPRTLEALEALRRK